MSEEEIYRTDHKYVDDITNSKEDVVNFLRELKLIDQGEIKKEWLDEISDSIKND